MPLQETARKKKINSFGAQWTFQDNRGACGNHHSPVHYFSGEYFHIHCLRHTVPTDSYELSPHFIDKNVAAHRSRALVSFMPVTHLCGKQGHEEQPDWTHQETELQWNRRGDSQMSHFGNAGATGEAWLLTCSSAPSAIRLGRRLSGNCPELALGGHRDTCSRRQGPDARHPSQLDQPF